MVPHKIEPAKRLCSAAYDYAGEIVLPQIPDQSVRATISCGDLADHVVNPGLIDIDDADRRPFAGKALRARSSHPGSRRGDDADLAFEPHGCLLRSGPQAAAPLLS